MRQVSIRVISLILSIYILSMAMDTVLIEKSIALIWLGLIYFAISLILRPLLLGLLLPVTVLTLGAFVLVINAWVLMIADKMTPNIQIGGFVNACIIALIVMVIEGFLKERAQDYYDI